MDLFVFEIKFNKFSSSWINKMNDSLFRLFFVESISFFSEFRKVSSIGKLWTSVNFVWWDKQRYNKGLLYLAKEWRKQLNWEWMWISIEIWNIPKKNQSWRAYYIAIDSKYLFTSLYVWFTIAKPVICAVCPIYLCTVQLNPTHRR